MLDSTLLGWGFTRCVTFGLNALGLGGCCNWKVVFGTEVHLFSLWCVTFAEGGYQASWLLECLVDGLAGCMLDG